MQINENMKLARKEAGFTQTEVAKQLNMTQQQYALYETGRREMPPSKLKIFCKVCNVRPDILFEWNKTEE